MPANLSPRQMHRAVQASRKRLANFRHARAMMVRNYVGPLYDRAQGVVGKEPLNLIFNAIRTIVPNIVMNAPKYRVDTEFVLYRDYADVLALALNFNSKQLRVENAYRVAIVDSMFALGILKTGLASSNTAVSLDDQTVVDPGMIYTEAVDFDNFIFDPRLRGQLYESAWMGDIIRVRRSTLLESGLYDNSLIERLPSCDEGARRDKTSDISMAGIPSYELGDYDDEVEVAEVWVRDANALVTVPAADTTTDEYLRIADYDGPDTGPYTTLGLSPPTPGNPLPPAPVGIWNDLHVRANRMMSKVLDQAERQKDLVFYRRTAADDAQEALDAPDGEAVAVDDPTGIAPVSFGGQNPSNEQMVDRLVIWHNMVAGNPQGIGGQALDADSATEASILQGNAEVTLSDMRNQVYTMAAEEGRKRAHYMHTDPLIEIPLSRRAKVPTPLGFQMQEQQVFLTPEARRGDFLDYHFMVRPESMTRLSAAARLQRTLAFATQMLPAAFAAAQVAAQLGHPFNVSRYVELAAEEAGIEWMDQVWDDPVFQMRMAMQASMGPPLAGSQGVPAGGMMPAMMQNGQPGQVGATPPGEDTQRRQTAQEGANAGQASLPVRET